MKREICFFYTLKGEIPYKRILYAGIRFDKNQVMKWHEEYSFFSSKRLFDFSQKSP
jgi:hypothetical protein